MSQEIENASDFILQNYGILTLSETNSFVMYNHGHYSYVIDSHINNIITSYYKTSKLSYSRQKRNQVVDFIRCDTQISSKLFDESDNRICLQNGHYIFDGYNKIIPNPNNEDGSYSTSNGDKLVMEKKFFRKHRSFDKQPYKTMYQLPIFYDPNAECLEIDNFLTEVFGFERVPLIYELIAYMIMPTVKYQKAFMLLGEGGNGKSTFLTMLRTFIGTCNTQELSLHELEKDFMMKELMGKLSNIVADLPARPLKNTGAFKQIVGDPFLSSSVKFKQGRVSFKNICKLIFSCNTLPKTNDTTRAFWRRWVLLRCTNIFTTNPNPDNINEKLKDPDVIDKITSKQELSGLLNKCIIAWYRIQVRKGFPEEWNDIEYVKDWWTLESSPLDLFVREYCMIDANSEINKDILYNEFCEFRRKYNLNVLDKGWFTRYLKQISGIGDTKTKYKGIKLRTNNT